MWEPTHNSNGADSKRNPYLSDKIKMVENGGSNLTKPHLAWQQDVWSWIQGVLHASYSKSRHRNPFVAWEADECCTNLVHRQVARGGWQDNSNLAHSGYMIVYALPDESFGTGVNPAFRNVFSVRECLLHTWTPQQLPQLTSWISGQKHRGSIFWWHRVRISSSESSSCSFFPRTDLKGRPALEPATIAT